MKYLGRIIRDGLTVAFLALCLAVMALWARSSHVADSFDKSMMYTSGGEDVSDRWDTYKDLPATSDRDVTFESWGGTAFVEYYRFDDARGGHSSSPGCRPHGWVHKVDYDPAPFHRCRAGEEQFAGFGWKRPEYDAGAGCQSFITLVRVPYWFIAGAASVSLLLGIRSRVRRWRRRRLNLCAACGYNLNGNTSGVCPECGIPLLRPSQPQNGARAKTDDKVGGTRPRRGNGGRETRSDAGTHAAPGSANG